MRYTQYDCREAISAFFHYCLCILPDRHYIRTSLLLYCKIEKVYKFSLKQVRSGVTLHSLDLIVHFNPKFVQKSKNYKLKKLKRLKRFTNLQPVRSQYCY